MKEKVAKALYEAWLQMSTEILWEQLSDRVKADYYVAADAVHALYLSEGWKKVKGVIPC